MIPNTFYCWNKNKSLVLKTSCNQNKAEKIASTADRTVVDTIVVTEF